MNLKAKTIYGPKCHNPEFLALNAEKTHIRFWPYLLSECTENDDSFEQNNEKCYFCDFSFFCSNVNYSKLRKAENEISTTP